MNQMPSWRHTAAQGLWRVAGIYQQVKGLEREEQLAHEETKYREWQKDMKEFNLLINATSNMKPQQRANVFTAYGQKFTEAGNQSMADIMGMLVRADEEDMVTAKQMSTEMAEILEDPSRDKLIQFEAKYPDTPTSLINRAWDDLRIERDEKKDVARIERERQGKIVDLKKEGWIDIGREARFEDLDDPTGRIMEAYGKRWYVPGKQKKQISILERAREAFVKGNATSAQIKLLGLKDIGIKPEYKPGQALEKVASLQRAKATFNKTGKIDAIMVKMFPEYMEGQELTTDEINKVNEAYDSVIEYVTKFTPGSKQKKVTLEGMPDPKKHKGKTVKDTTTGKRYQSDGINWNEI